MNDRISNWKEAQAQVKAQAQMRTSAPAAAPAPPAAKLSPKSSEPERPATLVETRNFLIDLDVMVSQLSIRLNRVISRVGGGVGGKETEWMAEIPWTGGLASEMGQQAGSIFRGLSLLSERIQILEDLL